MYDPVMTKEWCKSVYQRQIYLLRVLLCVLCCLIPYSRMMADNDFEDFQRFKQWIEANKNEQLSTYQDFLKFKAARSESPDGVSNLDDVEQDNDSTSDSESEKAEKEEGLPKAKATGTAASVKIDVTPQPPETKQAKRDLAALSKTYSVEQYFSSTSNPAKMKLRHVLRKASAEANDVYGNRTISHLSPGERRHIITMVIKACPELENSECQIDTTLAKMLRQAKHYQVKKELRQGKIGSAPGSKATKPSREKAGNKSKGPKNGTVMAKKPGEHSADQKKPEVSKKPKVANDMSDYERRIKARQLVNQAVRSAIKNCPINQLTKLKPGTPIFISNKDKKQIACCTFVQQHDDMYSKVALDQHLFDDQEELGEINLPSPVEEDGETGRAKKILFQELETCDIFLWKTERIETAVISGSKGEEESAAESGHGTRSSSRCSKPPSRLYSRLKN